MINQEPRLVEVTKRFWNYETKKYYTDRPEAKRVCFTDFAKKARAGKWNVSFLFPAVKKWEVENVFSFIGF